MDLVSEIQEIYSRIKEPLDRTPQGLVGELDYRCQWLARSAEIKADAQHLYDQKRGEVADRLATEKSSINATMMRFMVEGKSADEKRLLELADRLNAALTHQIEAIRSILSFEKQMAKY